VLHFVKNLGPGLITGAADDDPSGISTYSVAGASTGLSMLWLTLVSTPMMSVVQGMCARIAMVTGVGLAAVMRRRFPWLVLALAAIVVIANTFNLGADIAGMSASAHMVWRAPVTAWVVIFSAFFLVAPMRFPYRILANVFKWLTLSLFAYVVTAFVVHPHWGAVLRHLFVPEIHVDGRWLTTAMGLLGTTITPYLFFWQSSLMVEEEKTEGRTTVAERRGTTEREVADAHADINAGMIFSNVVAFFIIVTTASTLGAHGITSIATAQDAARALEPLAGKFAALLFTLGMIGTGLLAVPVLAGSSAYVVAEVFRFREGLDESPKRAPGFYGVLAAGVVIGMAMNLVRIDPIKALFWSAVLNGVAAVPLIVAITVLASDKKIMGRWRNSPLANFWGWTTVVLMGMSAVSMFVFWNQQ